MFVVIICIRYTSSHVVFFPFIYFLVSNSFCCHVRSSVEWHTFCFSSTNFKCMCLANCITYIQVSQEERAKLREGVPYVKLYRYNPKHLYPKLNGYGDNGQRSLKLWQLLYTYWLTNSYWNWQEYVVSVMLISVLNIKVTCEWHKAIKLNYKNTCNTVVFVLRLLSISRRPQLTVILWGQSYRAVKHSPRSLHEGNLLAGLAQWMNIASRTAYSS